DLELPGNGVDFGLRLLHRNAVFHASQDEDESLLADGLRPVDLQRTDEIDIIVEEREVLRQHSDDRDWFLVERHYLADNVGIAIEMPLPEPVRNHYDGRPVIDSIFIVRIQAPESRFYSERLENGRSKSVSVNTLRRRTIFFGSKVFDAAGKC